MKIKYVWEPKDLIPGSAFKIGDREYIIGHVLSIDRLVWLDLTIGNPKEISFSNLLEIMNSGNAGYGAIPCEVKLERARV